MSSLTGKVAIVTGAAQGIGRAIAETLARHGADIVVADMDPGRAEDTAAAIVQLGRRALTVKVNVANWEEVKEMTDRVVKDWSKVDILVNNAGITRDGLLLRMREEDWNLVLQVNLTGTFYCTKAVLMPMTKQRYGRIVNIASIVGVMGNVGQANYAASKGAVIGFTKTAAREYASRNVTVNAVAPGFIDTPMTQSLSPDVKEQLQKQIPLGRLGQPADIAEAVRFLVSDEAGYVTGQVLHVNGGMLMV
ncbi:MAG: 3-oxoacyl-[acyl-carrier-protein] reductase [Nitrospiraceae bacterium]